MIKIKLNRFFEGEVTYFPYRTANVEDVVLTIAVDGQWEDAEYRSEDAEYRSLKQRLCERATARYDSFKRTAVPCDGAPEDNHICFLIGGSIGVRFSDSKIYVGNGIKAERW